VSRYKPYPKYKESGVEWLGEVPEHWDVMKLKFIAHTQPSNIDKKSKENEANVLLCNYTDVYKNDYITNNMEFMKATATYEQIKKFKLDVGDVIITKDSEGPEDIAIAAYVQETQPNLVCGYHLTQIKPRNCNGAYLFRAFNSNGIHDQFKVAANGITRYGLSVYSIDNAYFPLPPKREQTAIANFLDRETAKIDTLIDKQRRLIELLGEKRQALISHAVTKGLDPNVKMKDSGVAWLREVPEHWDVMKLKYVLKLRNTKTLITNQSVIALENIEGHTGKYIDTDSNYQGEGMECKKGDVLFGKLRPYLAKVYRCKSSGIAFGDLLTYQPIKHFESSFAFYSLLSEAFIKIVDSSTYGAKMPRASADFINEMPLAVPPFKEQNQIANYLDTQTQKIDSLIDKANQAITLLQERRTALISAAVTGKIDVREEAK